MKKNRIIFKMKKIKFIVVMIVVLAMVISFVGCTEQTEQSEQSEQREQNAATEQAEQTEQTEQNDAAPIARHEWADAPADAEIPEGYVLAEDDIILSGLAYSVYGMENADGTMSYIAYADELDSDGNVIGSDWHVFVRFGNVVFADTADVEIPADYVLCDTVESDNGMHYGFNLYTKADDKDVRVIYGHLYDVETGELIKSDWFDIVGAKSDDVAAELYGDNVTVEEESVANGDTSKSDIVIDVPKTNPDILQNKPADKTDVDESEVDDDKGDVVKPSGPNSSTATGSGTNKPSAGDSTGGSTGGSSTSGGSSGGGSTSGSGNSSEPKTEQVWVVDVPAHTVEEPVYEERSVAICNRCEAILMTQSELDSHMKAHALNGEVENVSWRNEKRNVQVGTKTVDVPEQGHWETRVVE